MIGRLLQAADFKRLLAVPPRARSAHFVVHHLRGEPLGARSPFSLSVPARSLPAQAGLSTDDPRILSEPVDKFLNQPPNQAWVGVVIPKKQAKRAVTRNLMRRQIKAVSDRVLAPSATSQAAGLWLVRLKQGFATAEFPSASSPALRQAVRQELDEVLQRALQRVAAGPMQPMAGGSSRP